MENENDTLLNNRINSIAPLTLPMIKNLHKYQLSIIIIQREITLRNIVQEYENSLVTKDREIFKNQKNEILRLQELLSNDSSLYRVNKHLQTKVDKLKNKIDKLRLL